MRTMARASRAVNYRTRKVTVRRTIVGATGVPMCQSPHVAARKTDAERGPLGSWAYRTRDLLDLSVETVAAEMGAAPATIRKIEGGSNAKPSARMVRDLYAIYLRAAENRARPVAIEPPPGLSAETPPSDAGAGTLAAAFSELASWLQAYVSRTDARIEAAERRAAALEQLVLTLTGQAPELAPDLLAADQAWAEQADAASQRPRSDPTPDRAPRR